MHRAVLCCIAAAASLLPLAPAQAGWTGLSVTGALTVPANITLVTPFTSPATVGPGVEFTGAISQFGLWSILLDISDDQMRLDLQGSSANANLAAGTPTPVITLSVAGLTDAAGLELASYTCSSTGASCATFSFLGNGLLSEVSTPDSMTFSLRVMRHGASYVFATTPTPEPASLAVLGAALLGLAATRRRA